MCRILGTVTDREWPGVSEFRDYKPNIFPKWNKKDLRKSFPGVEEAAVDLMARMFIYPPHKRISAKKALDHPYFNELKQSLSSHR